MPRAKKTVKAVNPKDVLADLVPEKMDIDDYYDEDEGEYSEDYPPHETYANGYDPSKVVVNPITGTSKQIAPEMMNYILPGMGPSLSNTPEPVEEMAKSYPATKKNYSSNLDIHICLDKDVDLIKVADLMAKLKAVVDGVNIVDALVMNLNTNYYSANDGYEPIAK